MNDLDDWKKRDFEPLDDKIIDKMSNIVDMKTTIRKLNYDLKIMQDFIKPNVRYLIKNFVAEYRLIKAYKAAQKDIRRLKRKNNCLIKKLKRLLAWKKKKGRNLRTWVKKKKNR